MITVGGLLLANSRTSDNGEHCRMFNVAGDQTES
jgi:hypothetical protein